MQPDFFASLLPRNATSFLPPNSNQIPNQNQIQNGDSGAGFTSPGMNPQALSALMGLMGQGNPPSRLPPGAMLAPGASLPNAAGLLARAPGQPPQPLGGFATVGNGPLNGLAGMDPNVLRALLQRIGIGASSAPINAPQGINTIG
jgi:hypothetical protein